MNALRASHHVDLEPSVIVHGIAIPAAFTGLIQAIETSRYLLQLEDDWDDDGAMAFSEQTWRRAAETSVQLATELARHHDINDLKIEILPGANGGLDIDVHLLDRELLIAIPADRATQARFYGDDGDGRNQVKATLDTPDVPPWLAVWLTS